MYVPWRHIMQIKGKKEGVEEEDTFDNNEKRERETEFVC